MKFVILSLLFAYAASNPFVPININTEVGLGKTVKDLKTVGEFIADNTQNMSGCAEDGGCFNGWCWAKCGLGSRSSFKKWDSWCYTTRTSSQSFDYVRCSQDSDCNRCWKCAGSCTW